MQTWKNVKALVSQQPCCFGKNPFGVCLCIKLPCQPPNLKVSRAHSCIAGFGTQVFLRTSGTNQKNHIVYFSTYGLLLQCLSNGKIDFSISHLDVEIWSMETRKKMKNLTFFGWWLHDDFKCFSIFFAVFVKKSRRIICGIPPMWIGRGNIV